MDSTFIHGLPSYYYIVSVGDPADNNGIGATPSGVLRSGRYYTQTYAPAVILTARDGISNPGEFRLHQNYPNPFNPNTSIRFAIGVSSPVTLKVYDVLGRELANLVNEKMNAGSYTVDWDGSGFASGMYIYRLVAGSLVDTKKMMLMK